MMKRRVLHIICLLLFLSTYYGCWSQPPILKVKFPVGSSDVSDEEELEDFIDMMNTFYSKNCDLDTMGILILAFKSNDGASAILWPSRINEFYILLTSRYPKYSLVPIAIKHNPYLASPKENYLEEDEEIGLNVVLLPRKKLPKMFSP